MEMGHDAVWVALSKLVSSACVGWGLRNTHPGLLIDSAFSVSSIQSIIIAGNH